MRNEKDDTEFSGLDNWWIVVWFYWDRKSGRKIRSWGKDDTSCLRHHMSLCLGQLEKKVLEPRRVPWAEDSSIVVFLHRWLLKTKKWVRLSRESWQKEEKQAQDRVPWNSKSKEMGRGREPIKKSEKHIVFVERICFGIGQLWPYVSGQVTLPLWALISSFLIG